MRSFALCLWLVACASPSAAPPRPVTLPSYELIDVQGAATTLSGALRGSVAVIDLWATWCTACERERPKLARLDAAYREKGLRVIGLNVGETPRVVSAYLAENSVPYPIYLDPDFRLADALGDHQLPTILLVDRDGRIVQRATSLDQSLLDQIKALFVDRPKH